MEGTYQTITGRRLDLSDLEEAERGFLSAVREKYEESLEWSDFASWWTSELREADLSESSTTYRICQDLEARLGIVQGKVAPPDYRDYLADLIEQRYGSRYGFCKESGVDPGHLSRVLSSRSDLSLQNLQRILDLLHASLVIQSEEDLAQRLGGQHADRNEPVPLKEGQASSPGAPPPSRFPLLAQSGLRSEVAALRMKMAAMQQRVFPLAA